MNRRNFLGTLIAAAGLPFLVKKDDLDVFNRQRVSHDEELLSKKYFKYEAGKSQMVCHKKDKSLYRAGCSDTEVIKFYPNHNTNIYGNYISAIKEIKWLGAGCISYYLVTKEGKTIQTTEEIWNEAKETFKSYHVSYV